ncbi:MAG: phenylacetate--CoA ligase [Hyphomonadaceae bacterium]|nr:phenylacetate--CoA ligase [Hyphomonadaceae bacterium]
MNKRAGFHAIETAHRDEISALQLARLKTTLAHAYRNVAHYRAAFDAVGAHPDQLKTLSDLTHFPFTTKEDFRRNYPFDMFAAPREQIARIHASSGTTGQPIVVGYTAGDISTWADLVARSIYASGGRAGDIVHIAYGYGLFTGGLGAHYGAERLGCTVVPMSGGQTEKQVRLIRDFKPDIIMVTPSYMLALADEFVRQGVDPRSSSLRIGIHGAEPWTDVMRREIEEKFAIDAVDIYGLSEVIGPGVANECAETKDGPTIWEDHFYPEIIDPATGEALVDGEEGELVFTSLTKEAMPIVRYRTRDLTRLLPGTARSMRRMARIRGRCDDMLIIRGVNLFPTQIEELICEDRRLAPHYELHVSRPAHLDELLVKVESAAAAVAEAAAAREALAQRIKATIGVGAAVEVVQPMSLERSQGKARRVFDSRRL